jgi:predicted TIM-barrel fold metal-dependent hydrolase
MYVIDAHTHLGVERLWNHDMKLAELLAYMEKYNIDTSIVQPQAGAKDVVADHKMIADAVAANPGKLYGMADFNPVEFEEDYFKLNKWAIDELGFIGIKLHTHGHSVASNSKHGEKAFKAAQENKVPLMIHTGKGVPAALPSLAIPMAMKYKDVPVVLAHAGTAMYAAEAIVAAQVCENIFLETSWIPSTDLRRMLNAVGPEKLMFGTDLFLNIEMSFASYSALSLTDSVLEQCMSKTAKTVYKI